MAQNNCFKISKSVLNQHATTERMAALYTSIEPLKHSLDELRILRVGKVTDALGIAKSTFYKLVADGKFPKPTPIGARSVGWPSHVVISYLTSLGAK